ncbi:TetR/AcrR family transcriptional regulator [Natronomonas amylolytica]|uniref:TetR/AcrR family transcriptional regulator n=1 Tax=Natronomonas amylolytica TaxID=3108498 RepID=UPI00300A13B7
MTDFFESPDSTREEILAAAYRALCRHGYAPLTIEKIGAELDKSTSLVYHHYEGKDDLLLACLEFMLDQYEADFVATEISDPKATLDAAFDEFLAPGMPSERYEFIQALVELRGQAPHDERYRKQFDRSDRLFERRFAELIEAGIETGQFRAVDAESVAAMLHTLFSGALFKHATAEDESGEALRAEIDAYLEARLYA